MSPTFELVCCSTVLLFWLAPLLIVTLCVAAGGCVRVADVVRRALGRGRPAAELE
jgi:hypothetical protein